METIQLSIDPSLLAEAEQTARSLEMSPSDFVKVALERALQQRETIAKERRDAEGYLEHPQRAEEIEEWQDEQEWGDNEAG